MRFLPALFILFLAAMTLAATSCSPQLTPTLIPTRTLIPTLSPSPSVTPTATPIIDTIEGRFQNQIRYLENDMPRANSEGYVVPTDEEQAAFAQLVAALGASDLVRAAQLAAQNHYGLHYYVDRNDDHAVSYLLREDKPIQKGWGLYAFRVGSASNIIIQAPHPLFDINTPSVALNIYRALDARALLIAGAHRDANLDGSADVSHNLESVFQSVHEALLQEIQAISGNAVILQIHGFNSGKHDGYPQVVFGFGDKAQPAEFALARKLKDAISEQGITVGLCTGDFWQDLCGTTNVQAYTSNDAIFIHIELDEMMRKNDEGLITALVQVFGLIPAQAE